MQCMDVPFIYRYDNCCLTLFDPLLIILAKTPERCAETEPSRLINRLSRTQQNAILLKLSPSQMRQNIEDAYTDAIKSLSLLALPKLGCKHTQTEWFSKCGDLDPTPEVFNGCGSQCHVCSGEYKTYFLPII